MQGFLVQIQILDRLRVYICHSFSVKRIRKIQYKITSRLRRTLLTQALALYPIVSETKEILALNVSTIGFFDQIWNLYSAVNHTNNRCEEGRTH